MEQAVRASADDGDSASVTVLLREILQEVKKFNLERDILREEVDALKTSNKLLLETVTQQQRFLEYMDSEKRAKNLILLGISETRTLAIEGGNARTDEEKVTAIFKKIGQGTIRPVTMQRLGNSDVTRARARPLKVVLELNSDQQKILADSKKLKQSGEGYDTIFIKRDVHPATRKEMARLYSVEETEKKKPENAGRIVAFDKKKRVITVDGTVIDQYKPSFF